MIGLSERRRQTPASLRSPVAASEAEARQVEREVEREAEMVLMFGAARAEAVLEFIAERDREPLAMSEDRAHALGRKIPASKGMPRWVITHLDLDGNDEFMVTIALVRGGADVFAADDELCPEALVKRLHRQRPGHFNDPGRFFFTKSNGEVLPGDVITALLRLAAVAIGNPPVSVEVISLRAGGASWKEVPASKPITERSSVEFPYLEIPA